MSLGVLSDEQFEAELSKPSARVHTMPSLGRGVGNDEIPESIRALAASLAIEGASNKEVAEALDISPSSVSAYKKGATSTSSYNEPDKKLHKTVKSIRERIVGKASTRAIHALNSITKDKLSELSAKDASSIAKDMSAIVKNMTENQPEGQNTNIQFVVMAPQMKKEESYEVVDALPLDGE